MAENWDEWEPRLLGAGYEFMLFDGLNRYYAAREAQDVIARFPRERPEWGAVPTFGLWERAPVNAEHPDHALALRLVRALLAALPRLDPALLLDLLASRIPREELEAPPTAQGREAMLDLLMPGESARRVRERLAAVDAESLRAFAAHVIDSDDFRIALARIAMSYDGGQIVDGETI